jgi:uncharacterized protein (TIGR01244 family)
MSFRTLDDRTMVAGQIRPEDIAEAGAAGVRLIVNNRPDGEEPGQPVGAEIEAAARAAGIGYRFLPIAGTIAPEAVAAMAALLDDAQGRILMFCRSGTRSTFLWALAQARRGGEGATILAQAEAAGYDLSPLRRFLLR